MAEEHLIRVSFPYHPQNVQGEGFGCGAGAATPALFSAWYLSCNSETSISRCLRSLRSVSSSSFNCAVSSVTVPDKTAAAAGGGGVPGAAVGGLLATTSE